MIKTGGINVAPVEVEEMLMAHAAVRLAYVTGVPDPQRDEVAAALVVCQPGQSVESIRDPATVWAGRGNWVATVLRTRRSDPIPVWSGCVPPVGIARR
jgi:acyl-coenzyme A synthetase/AMP-(fatty) acid ligase